MLLDCPGRIEADNAPIAAAGAGQSGVIKVDRSGTERTLELIIVRFLARRAARTFMGARANDTGCRAQE